MRVYHFVISLVLFSTLNAQDSLLFKQARDAYFAGQPDQALQILDSDPTIKEGIHRVAYYLNAGSALSSLGQYEKSNEYFDYAYRIIEDSSKNIGGKALSYLLNPMTTLYQGEIAEQLILHLFKIQNYLALQDGSGAAGELERMEARITNHKGIYEGKNVYTGQTLFYLLYGIVSEFNGDTNTALQMYMSAYEMYATYTEPNFGTSAPWQLKADIVRLSTGEDQQVIASEFGIDPASLTKTDNEVIVFWQNGKSPTKKTQLLNLQILPMNGSLTAMDASTGEQFPVAMAAGMGAANMMMGGGTNVPLKFARYVDAQPEYTSSVIGAVSLDPFQDFNAILKQSLFDRKSADIGGMMGRHLAKGMLKNQAKKQISGLINKVPGASALGANKLANKAVDNAVNKTEKADWRQWDMLPASIGYGRLYLPEGEQTLTIINITKDGKSEVKVEKVNVPSGSSAYILRTFNSSDYIEQAPSYNYAASGADVIISGNIGTQVSVNPMSLADPGIYPASGMKAMYTEFAGKKLEEGQYSVIVGRPDEALQSGTITLNFERNKTFVGSAAGAMVIINGEDQTKVKNGNTNTIQIEANGKPLALTVRNAIIKSGKKNPLEKRVKILYYPTRSEENFYINFGATKMHEIMTHKSLVD